MRTPWIACVAGVLAATSGAYADDTAKASAKPAAPVLRIVGAELTPAMVKAGLTTAASSMNRCGDLAKAATTVTLAVKIAADGKVADATATGSNSADLDSCLVAAVKTATFKATKAGGSFSYPITYPGAAATTELDRATITAGIAKVKAKISACGDASKAGGTVKAKVEVAADGKVTTATAEGSADTQLNTCVATAIKSATFGKTNSGGAFSYPFVFGASDASTSKSRVAGPPSPPPESSSGSALDRAIISAGITKVKASISACAGKAKGTVKIKVQVAPAGTVASAQVTQAPDEALGKCVAGVIRKATFAKTDQGGTFTYPFVF